MAIPTPCAHAGGGTVDPRAVQPDTALRRPLQPDDDLQGVLFPAPFGPTTATISPSSIPNVTPSTAGRPPKRFVTSSTSRSRFGLRYYPGQYGVSGCDLNTTLGQKVVDAVFSPVSGGADLVRTANCTRGRSSSPHAVHQRERVAGDVERRPVDVCRDRLRLVPTFWMACATIFTYA